MSAIILQQEIIHYEVLGRGRPVLFLHGWLGSWRYWVPTMQAVSTSFRTYALDLLGFGDSVKRSSAMYRLADQEQLLEGFLEQMGIMRVVLVGHGLGALVALNYALHHTTSVDRLMLVSYPLDHNTINSRLRSDSPGTLAEWLLGRNSGAEPVLAETLKTDPRALQASLTNLDKVALWNDCKSLSIPNLLIYGQEDQIVPPPGEDRLNELTERQHAMIFEQAGHFPMLDESSKFNRLLLDFLALNSGDSPRQLQLKEQWKRLIR